MIQHVMFEVFLFTIHLSWKKENRAVFQNDLCVFLLLLIYLKPCIIISIRNFIWFD